jgi:hypothetical protein
VKRQEADLKEDEERTQKHELYTFAVPQQEYGFTPPR